MGRDLRAFVLGRPLLQADPGEPFIGQQRQQLRKPQAAPCVVLVRLAPGPGNADAQAARCRQVKPFAPMRQRFFGHFQGWQVTRNGVWPGRKGTRQRHQGAVQIPSRPRLFIAWHAGKGDDAVTVGPLQQSQGGRRTDKADLGKALCRQWQITRKLKGVAKTLLGDDQQTLALGIGLSIPLRQWRQRTTQAAIACFGRAGPAGLVIVPAVLPVAQFELCHAQIQARHGKFGG